MSRRVLRIAARAAARLHALLHAPSAAMKGQGRQLRRKRRAATGLFAAIARFREPERAEP